MLLGQGGIGKSKFGHLVGQDFCIKAKKGQYLEATAIDPLGMLSFSGELEKAALLIMSDVEGGLSNKQKLNEEDLKHMFLPTECGSIQNCRYRVCKFPVGLPRIFALNGSSEDIGAWFTKYGFAWLDDVLRNLVNGNTGAAMAFAETKTADQKAVFRRLTFAFPDSRCVKDDFVATLQQNTAEEAADEEAVLDAFYASMEAAED